MKKDDGSNAPNKKDERLFLKIIPFIKKQKIQKADESRFLKKDKIIRQRKQKKMKGKV